MTAVIRCERLSKRYSTGERLRYRTLRDVLASAVRRRSHEGTGFVWSLREVSFEVSDGDVVGIIGRNGAGKSTLLRILAGITEPTEGQAIVRGRVGSLLEVGTGFHPELTGRENVYLNGAILGMSRREIDRKFDEIVAFAAVDPYLDTPVKRYSTGMHMRLAFSVAAHLEPEILLVDEVLAVGDAEFQRKCLEKMGTVAQAGRTVVFVSHDLGAVQRLCRFAGLLDRGRLVQWGQTRDVVVRYLATGATGPQPGEWVDLSSANRRGTGEARFTRVRYSSLNATYSGHPFTDGPLVIEVDLEARKSVTVQAAEVFVRDGRGVKLLDAATALLGRTLRLEEGVNRVRFSVERLHLNPGHYTLGLWLARLPDDPVALDHVDVAVSMEVLPSEPERLVGYSTNYGPVSARVEVEHTVPDASHGSTQ